MYPEQEPNDNQLPAVHSDLDYLNQIATKPTPSRFGFLDKKILILIGVVGVLIIATIVLAAVNSGSKTTPSGEILRARLGGLVTLIDFGNQNITNTSLGKVTAEASLVISSNQYLLSSTIGTAAVKPETAAVESVDSIVANLETAKSMGDLDNQYLKAILSQFGSVKTALLNFASESASSASQSTINETIANIDELVDRLSDD
ncbi:MAG: hypothetical protein LBC95_02710 [Candidatus Nomurabacteria bacterium]|jgi:hypothetical protein|nr:hypothetical protein [Candidatus Nomurabacteria bacterium]